MPKQNKTQAPALVTFYASLADIQNAITFKGNGDGGRIVLEAPRSEAGALLLLQQFGAARLLRVRIEFLGDPPRDDMSESTESSLADLMQITLDSENGETENSG